jgi:hypothetical protein
MRDGVGGMTSALLPAGRNADGIPTSGYPGRRPNVRSMFELRPPGQSEMR